MSNLRQKRHTWRLSIALLLTSCLPSTAAVFTIGNVSPDPATTTSSIDLNLGNTSDGAMQVDGGSSVVSRDGYAGRNAGVHGTAWVAGEDSSWTHRNMYVGYSGNGGLYLSDGATVLTSDDAFLAYSSGSSGDSAVENAGTSWSVSDTLYVGYSGEAALEVLRGGSVTTTYLRIGNNVGSVGRVTLQHGNSQLNASGSIVVGASGKGTLEIYPGNQVTGGHTIVGLSNTDSRISLSQGTLAVTSLLAAPDHLLGFGDIITHGLISDVDLTFDQDHPLHQNLLLNSLPGQYVEIDLDVNGVGMMGAGFRGNSTLSIADGVSLGSSWGYVGYFGGSSGLVTVDGPGSSWNNISDQMFVGYRGAGIVNVQTHAKLTVGGPSDTSSLYLGYVSGSNGTLNISSGATVEVFGSIELSQVTSAMAALNLSGGALKLHGGPIQKVTSSLASFNFTGGRLEGVGNINMRGAFVQSGGTFAPGNTIGATTVTGGYTFDTGTLEIELNGLGGSTLQDSVIVTGAVNLLGANGLADGILDVKLNFAPAAGNQFIVINNDGTDAVVGQFANGSVVRAIFADHVYQFSINYAAGNDVTLITQTINPVGDFNSDGIVDAADYVVWRNSKDASVERYFGADGNGNGVVDNTDLALWRSHFGMITGGGGNVSVEAAVVPEPSAAPLATMLLGVCLTVIRRRRAMPVLITEPSQLKNDR